MGMHSPPHTHGAFWLVDLWIRRPVPTLLRWSDLLTCPCGARSRLLRMQEVAAMIWRRRVVNRLIDRSID